ncbi:MAG: LemA family protein [Clostridia bacterium]|nr:LemA family protein [Clostridia bacterium]MDE7084708.1 LemA family protein [Clostridia bacterium]
MNFLLSTGAIAGIAIAAVFVLIVIILVCWGISARNNFVRLKNGCEEAFSTIDIYLKKRYDLIPNLVETVKGYAKHESETLEKVVAARNRAATASTTAEKIEADANVSNAIKSINMVAERYPELKANANFMDLSNQLKSIETQLADQRRYYNGRVKAFNTDKDLFPKSVIASMMHLEKMPYFELDSAEERQNVKIKF